MDNSEIFVLIIDDDASFADLTQMYLEEVSENIQTNIEFSGEEGVEFFEENITAVDAIICDYDMPRMDGIETLNEIRKISSVPFILFTGKGNEEVASEAISSGASDYLQKGGSRSKFEVLANRVEQYVEKASLVEENSRVSNEKNRLLERVDDAFFSYDDEFRFQHLNKSGLALLSSLFEEEMQYEDVVGKNIWKVTPPEVEEELREPFMKAMETGEDVEFEFYYPDENAWLEVRLYPSNSGLSVFVRDVTEKQQRILNRERENKLLMKLYQTASDSDASQYERLSKAVRSGRKFFELPIGFIAKVNSYEREITIADTTIDNPDIVEGNVTPIEESYCQTVLETDELVALNNVLDSNMISESAIERFGLETYISQKIVVDDELYGILCFAGKQSKDSFSDSEKAVAELLTAWVSYEIERNIQRERLEEQNRRLDAFAGFISHDLRNPLSIASGYLEVVQQEDDNPSKYLQKIENAHTRMDNMITELLELARSSDELQSTEPIDIRSVAEKAWRNIETKDSTLEIETDLVVDGDCDKLLNVFENLFRNSIEHNNDSVTVTVGDKNDGFYIADNGSGVNADSTPQIFEYGMSENNSHGFGLAIAREIVEAHNWKIQYTDKYDGARFEITTVKY